MVQWHLKICVSVAMTSLLMDIQNTELLLHFPVALQSISRNCFHLRLFWRGGNFEEEKRLLCSLKANDYKWKIRLLFKLRLDLTTNCVLSPKEQKCSCLCTIIVPGKVKLSQALHRYANERVNCYITLNLWDTHFLYWNNQLVTSN